MHFTYESPSERPRRAGFHVETRQFAPRDPRHKCHARGFLSEFSECIGAKVYPMGRSVREATHRQSPIFTARPERVKLFCGMHEFRESPFGSGPTNLSVPG